MSHSKGVNITEECHVVNMIPPVDVGGVAKVGDRVSMEGYAKCSIIVTMGVVTNATTFTCYESTTAAGGSEDAISTIYYYAETTELGDTMAARTSGATIVSGTTDSVMYVIDIDASSLTAAHDWIGIKTDGAAAAFVSAVAVLSGTRYQSGITDTAIA